MRPIEAGVTGSRAPQWGCKERITRRVAAATSPYLLAFWSS